MSKPSLLQNSDSSQLTETKKRPFWRKCRRPFFWATIVMFFFIMVDAVFELCLEKSFLGLYHWLGLRTLDFILSVLVWLQSRKLEHLLEEKDEKLKRLGYTEEQVSSDAIQIRRKQLRWISFSYLAGNMLVFAELVMVFGLREHGIGNCVEVCANPYNNGASILLLSFAVCQLVPTHFFLVAFYILVRR